MKISTTMRKSLLPRFYFLAGFALVISLLSGGAAIFSRTCISDGCIGVAMLGGAATIAYLSQVFVLIPTCTLVGCRAHPKSKRAALTWMGVSTAAFFAPMLFLKGGVGSVIWILKVAPTLLAQAA